MCSHVAVSILGTFFKVEYFFFPFEKCRKDLVDKGKPSLMPGPCLRMGSQVKSEEEDCVVHPLPVNAGS